MSAACEDLNHGPVHSPLRVSDTHSKLNVSDVRACIAVRTVDDVVAGLEWAGRRDLPTATCGGRHAMGGQQFASDGLLLDMSSMDRVLHFDSRSGQIEVEAGMQWPRLMQDYLALQQGSDRQWGIRQKQTGADRLSIGGALAANIHGRVLRNKPIVEDVLSLRLVDAQGRLLNCSRDENADLFRLVIGGYGLFGVVVAATLQLVPRQKVQRIVEIAALGDLHDAFASRIADGYLYGDFQFVTDETSDRFLDQGVFSCYRPVANDTPIPAGQTYMTERSWQDLLYLAHVDKSRAFDEFSRFYLETSEQVYWSDAHQFSIYLDDYHGALDKKLKRAHAGSEMITELYVPPHRLPAFIEVARDVIRSSGADLVYGTIRLIRKDDESFLAWARQDYACVIFNLHVDHCEQGIAASRAAFVRLIDAALAHDGSFFLTYHRYATRRQVLDAYPQFPEFLRRKAQRDPASRFASDWFKHYDSMIAGVP